MARKRERPEDIVLKLRQVGDRFGASCPRMAASASWKSPVVSRLTGEWQQEYNRWQRRDLSARRYLYIWADGVYLQARMSDLKSNDRASADGALGYIDPPIVVDRIDQLLLNGIVKQACGVARLRLRPDRAVAFPHRA